MTISINADRVGLTDSGGYFTGTDVESAMAEAGARLVAPSIYFTGAASNSFTAPDSAALDLTGDIDIIAWIKCPDYSPATGMRIVSKINGAATTTGGGYELYVGAAGQLNFQISTGSAARDMASSIGWGTDGVGYWVRGFYNDTAKTTRFSKSTEAKTLDPADVTWTTINTSVAHGGGSPAAGTMSLTVGDMPNLARQLTGEVSRVQVWSGESTAGGTLVADWSAVAMGNRYRDSLGNVWSPNGSAWSVVVSNS